MDYLNPIDVGINMVTKNCMGFIKVHLLSPHKDRLIYSRGACTFVTKMEDSEKVINKVEKGFELNTKARNLHLHIKGDILWDTHAQTIFQDIVKESYYEEKQLEFLSLMKLELMKGFTFLTLSAEEASDTFLKCEIIYNQ